MGRQRKSIELFVYMNGRRVGTLLRTSSGQLEFTYHDTWLEWNLSRPISLSLPLSSSRITGERVESFFDNLLPDSVPIRNRIQSRFSAPTNKSFDLLWHTGRDCVGALQLLPADEEQDIRTIKSKPLTDSDIANTLKNYRVQPLGMGEEDDFRISIAGAQEKTALLWRDNKWQLPLGVTPTSHIFKLPIGVIQYSQMDLSDSVENEWLCHLILKEYGIPVANAEMHTFEDVKVLVVERFDRKWSNDRSWLMRLPQEDMCQALGIPSALKYESDGGPGIQPIMDLLLGAEDNRRDRQTFLTVNLLFWLLAAVDGHAKNFSLFLRSGGSYRLTPMYDVMSAHPLVARRQMSTHKLKMAMALQGKKKGYQWNRLFYRHWLSTAKHCHFPVETMQRVIEEVVDRMDDMLANVESQLPEDFPEAVAESIFKGMRKGRDRLALGGHTK